LASLSEVREEVGRTREVLLGKIQEKVEDLFTYLTNTERIFRQRILEGLDPVRINSEILYPARAYVVKNLAQLGLSATKRALVFAKTMRRDLEKRKRVNDYNWKMYKRYSEVITLVLECMETAVKRSEK